MPDLVSQCDELIQALDDWGRSLPVEAQEELALLTAALRDVRERLAAPPASTSSGLPTPPQDHASAALVLLATARRGFERALAQGLLPAAGAEPVRARYEALAAALVRLRHKLDPGGPGEPQ